MKLISLACGSKVKISDTDFSKVNKLSWCIHSRGYAHAYYKGKKVLMHRFIKGLGAEDSKIQVDHRNSDRLDNRRSNLRLADNAKNQANRRKTVGISKYKGVTFDKCRNKWIAQIKVDQRHIFLGRFDKEKDAAMKYDKEAIRFFGRFARLNCGV